MESPPTLKTKSVNDIEKVLCNSRCKKIKIALLGAPHYKSILG